MNAMILRPGPFAGRRPPTSGRYISVCFVVLLHAGILYALFVSLGVHLLPKPPTPPVTVTNEPRIVPPEQNQVVPQTNVVLITPRLIIPPPPVNYDDHSITATPESFPTDGGGFIPSPIVAHDLVRIQPAIDDARSHRPDYPAISRRLGEEGTVILSVLVDPTGIVLEAKVDRSSGFARLDQAALGGVQHNYHFTAGTLDGKPVALWKQISVVFRLNEQ